MTLNKPILSSESAHKPSKTKQTKQSKQSKSIPDPIMDSYTFKIVMIGGTSVGKSAIFRRYMQGSFEEEGSATISASYLQKTVQLPDSD